MTDAAATPEPKDGSRKGDPTEDHYRPCVLSGEIRTAGTLCDVISFLAHAAWWGELVVEHGDVLRSLYFDEGQVVAATSTAPTERIGDVLVKIGALTQAQADDCGERAADRNLRFGEAVVELGFLTREKLFGLMGKQIEEIFCGVAAIDTGSFVFLEGFDDAELSYRLRCSVDALLLDAIRRMDEKRFFRSRIPSGSHVPAPVSDAAPPKSDPFDLFSKMDGTRSVAELAESSGLAELDVTRALFQHVHTGHASIKAPRLGVQKTVEVYNSAIVVLLAELDAIDRGDEVRAQLATFASTSALDASFAGDLKPAADGTLDVGRISASIASSPEPAAGEERLGKWLYDYASYAVFLARPHVARRDGERASASAPAAETDARSPAVTTQRLRKTTVVPGVDPSRTARMDRVRVDARAVAPRTMRLAAYTPPARLQRPAFVLPSPKAVVPVAQRPAPISASPAVATKNRSPKTVPVLALVAAVCITIALFLGPRMTLVQPAPTTPKASAPRAKTELLVACIPSCSVVYVDGNEVASRFEPIAVPAGPHDVVAFEQGFVQQLKHVDVREGQSLAVAFRLVPPSR